MVEELLKSGQIPCIVATSSLELGIDMGAVDLVIQVESPKSVARGMQRVGRAGHELGSVSKGRIFPKFRSDLLECAVVAKRMRSGEIEETVIPRNPLDVLAQQIVAMVADEEWDGRRDRARSSSRPSPTRSSPASSSRTSSTCSTAATRRSASPSCARGSSGTGPPGTVRGRKGARQLAVTNAGTIPDRGLFGVHLPDGRRVGELDEEMVYEARAGQVFLLGASSWRIEEITRDRVIVTPAPGVPGAIPFWRGEGIGRPVELGRAIGEFSREAVDAEPEDLAADLRPRRSSRPRTSSPTCASSRRRRASSPPTRRSSSSASATRSATGGSASSRPFGGRVHAAWGLALAARIRDELELEADAIWSDDGIVIHLPDSDQAPASDLVLLEPDEVEDLIVGELSGSALFGARFREAAGRSLLIPRAYPGKRTPLWQQRLKSQSLLEVAKDFPRFPITLETYREVLRDVLDLPALGEILRDLKSRRISLVEVETQSASPFASSLLFDYVATYMYEGDTPNAERRAAALALDRDLLRELLGQEELRELIDPAALADVEDSLQHRVEQARAVDRDQLQRDPAPARRPERRRGATSGSPRATRRESMLGKLEAERRAVQGADRRRGALDRRRGRRPLPRRARRPGARRACRTRSSRRSTEPMEALLRRYARTHVPFPTAQAAAALRRRPDPGAEAARGGRRAGPRRAAARRHRARVVRPRRPAPAAPRQPRRAPQGGRGRRHRRARPLPRLLAERRRLPPGRRRPRPPAREPRAAAGRRADARRSGSGTCCRAGSAPTRRPGSTSSRPAARSSGSAPGRSAAPAGSPSTSARTCGSPARRRRTPSSSGPRARSTTRSASCSPSGPASGSTSSSTSPRAAGRRRSSTPRSGTSPGRAR